MRRRSLAARSGALLAVLGVALAGACSRADVYPISGVSAGDGGGSAGDGGGLPGDGGGLAGDAGGGDAACVLAALASGDTSRRVMVGTVARTYVLHVPSSYDGRTPVPLIVDFHGIGESGASERDSSPYPAVVDREGVIMAFPDGLRGPAGNGWNVGPCCVAGVDDVAFARAVVAQIQTVACIDRTRVYAAGVLTGGGMAHYVACHAADVFAAAAPAAFDLLEENVDDCKPSRAITVMSFRGTAADSRVPYSGGASSLVAGMPLTFLGAQATFAAWARIDGCPGSPAAADANGCSSYAGCRDGAEVILCTKQGGHEDPADATLAWPVLSRHAL